MHRVVTASEAREQFDELLQRVTEDGQPIVVAHEGKPQAVLISMAEYKRLGGSPAGAKLELQEWLALADQVREQARIELAGRPLPPPEEVIRQMREERDAELLDLR